MTHALQKTCGYYLPLFQQPEFLLERFSKGQIEAGFWAIQGSIVECSVTNLIWDTDLALTDRE